MPRRIRRDRRASRNSAVASRCLLGSLRPPLRQNSPTPPPSSSSANASFLSPPPPTLRLLPPPSAAQAFIGWQVDVNARGGARVSGVPDVTALRPRIGRSDWPRPPGLVTRRVRSRCLERPFGSPASSCSPLIGRRLTATRRGAGGRGWRGRAAGRREAFSDGSGLLPVRLLAFRAGAGRQPRLPALGRLAQSRRLRTGRLGERASAAGRRPSSCSCGHRAASSPSNAQQ